MTALAKRIKLSGKSTYFYAKLIGGRIQDTYYFVQGKRNKIGRSRKKQIKAYFISIGLITPPKPKPKHECPTCGVMHTCKTTKQKPSTQLHLVDTKVA